MEILKFPNKALLTKCEPVTVFGPELRFMSEQMVETMRSANGMGLAANQVGFLYRMFVMALSGGGELTLVNPKILRRSKLPANFREGCLSAPGEFLVLSERTTWVEVEFNDAYTGQVWKRIFKDLEAVCVQHEIDHLNGKSHLQSMSIPKQKRKELAKKWGLK